MIGTKIGVQKLESALIGLAAIGLVTMTTGNTVISSSSKMISTTQRHRSTIAQGNDGRELQPEDMVTCYQNSEGFTQGKEYEVQQDQQGKLFIEDDRSFTWNVISVDGEKVQLEHDGRIVLVSDETN